MMTDDFKHHAGKIINNHSNRTSVLLETNKTQKVNAAEFIVDSLFALDIGVQYLPHFAVPISQQWVDYVLAKSQNVQRTRKHAVNMVA